MQFTDMLAQTGGLQSMARELGVSEAQAASGAAALLPALLGGFKKQAQSQPSGLEGLGGLLGQLGGGGLLDDVLAPQPTDVRRGNDVLGQIFGSQDVSRAVAQDAAAQSGLAPALLKKMLPLLAMLVASYLAKPRGADANDEALDSIAVRSKPPCAADHDLRLRHPAELADQADTDRVKAAGSPSLRMSAHGTTGTRSSLGSTAWKILQEARPVRDSSSP
jgi:hypothetical protein